MCEFRKLLISRNNSALLGWSCFDLARIWSIFHARGITQNCRSPLIKPMSSTTKLAEFQLSHSEFFCDWRGAQDMGKEPENSPFLDYACSLIVFGRKLDVRDFTGQTETSGILKAFQFGSFQIRVTMKFGNFLSLKSECSLITQNIFATEIFYAPSSCNKFAN